MKTRPFHCFVIPFLSGVAIGSIYVVLFATGVLGSFCADRPAVAKVIEVIHAPAWLLVNAVAALHLPPHGNAGCWFWWSVCPALQWVILGFVVGVVWYVVKKRIRT